MNKKSVPRIYTFNAGSCNGCDIEVSDTALNCSRGKCQLVETPEYADVVIITGIVTKKIKPDFVKMLKQIPKNAKVLAIGSCALSGNAFADGYSFAGPVNKYIKIDAYIAGCPPRPKAIMDAIKGDMKTKITTKGFRGRLKYFPEKCILCWQCVKNCPASCIKTKPAGKDKIEFSYLYDKCMFCKMCQRVCPTGAIVLTEESKTAGKDRDKFKTAGKTRNFRK